VTDPEKHSGVFVGGACDAFAMRQLGRDLTIGERVGWYRRRRGISQEVLAGLVDRTTDWLSKVENGRANLERLSVIKSLADALDVTVGDLLGEPAVLEWAPTAPGRTLGLLRDALMDYPTLTGTLSNARAVPRDELRRAVEDVWSGYQASRFGYVATRLPSVLAGARNAVADATSADASADSQRILALSYHAAAATLTKVGEADLSWIASDRGLMAAEQSEDFAVIAGLLRSVTHSMMANGRYDAAADVASRATDRLASVKRAEPVWWSLLGSLYLAGAMASARADQRGEARTFMARARQVSQQVGNDANHAWTAFGPTNVAVHDVSVALELGDIQVALDLAPRVDATALPVERRIRHSLEVARVYHLFNRREAALATVLHAERDAAEQVRYHYIARELVVSWMRSKKVQGRAEIDALAHRLRLA